MLTLINQDASYYGETEIAPSSRITARAHLMSTWYTFKAKGLTWTHVYRMHRLTFEVFVQKLESGGAHIDPPVT
jgi:hypothetical protein